MDKNNGAIYDARKLGKPKMIILGVRRNNPCSDFNGT